MPLYLLLFNIKLYIKNYFQAIYIYVFYIAVMTLSIVAGNAASASHPDILIRSFWVASLLSTLFISTIAFNAEEENGVLGYVSLWPVATEWLVLSKFIAIQLLIIAPLALISWVIMQILGISPQKAGEISWILTIAMASISAITVFTSILTGNLGGRGVIGAILILPLTVPVMIAGSAASIHVHPLDHAGYGIILAHAGLMVPLSIMIGAAILRSR